MRTHRGRRVRVDRPRVRNREGQEVELPSFSFASSRDALDDRTLDAMACGGRKYEAVSEREKIKKRTMRKRKKEYLAAMAA